MVITPLVKATAEAILEHNDNNTFASAIKKHSPVGLNTVASHVKSGDDLKEIDGFKSSLAIIGLFVAHKDSFLEALDEIAFADDQFAGGYMVELTGGNKDTVIHSIAMLKNYKYFDEAPPCSQLACYNIIHAIVIHVVTHVVAAYNLQSGLLVERVKAFEEQ